MPCVYAKRKEAGRQATEKEIEKRKGRDEEGKNTNAENTNWNPTFLAGRAPREETGPPSCPHNEIGRFFSVVVHEWLAEKLLVREVPFRERPGSGRQCSTTWA